MTYVQFLHISEFYLFHTKYLFLLAIDRFNQFLSSTKFSQQTLFLCYQAETAILTIHSVLVPGTIFLISADSRNTRRDPIPWVMDPFSFLLSITGCTAWWVALTIFLLLSLPNFPSPLLCPHLPVKFVHFGLLWHNTELTQGGITIPQQGGMHFRSYKQLAVQKEMFFLHVQFSRDHQGNNVYSTIL